MDGAVLKNKNKRTKQKDAKKSDEQIKKKQDRVKEQKSLKTRDKVYTLNNFY